MNIAALGEADQIMLPGRCRADLDRLSARYGVPVVPHVEVDNAERAAAAGEDS